MYRDLPPLTWLRAFEVSARLLSFTAAAQELHLTQAAVSKHVKSLEQRLQRPLFVRHPRSLELTRWGDAYLPKVQDALERLAHGTREVFGRRQDDLLTIRCSVSFAVNWLSPRLPRFLAEAPESRLRILCSVWADPFDAEALDLDIQYGTGDFPGAVSYRLTQEVLTPLCAPALAAGPATLVVVQSESFFDPRRLFSGIRRDVLSEFDSLRSGAICHGQLQVAAWGANTVRTEFAFLSGLAAEALGVHRFNPYRRLARQGVATLATFLRHHGYRTICVHPYAGSFYARHEVFPQLGFDEFIDIRAFTGAVREGPYVSDLAVAEKVAALLQTAAGQPLFVFVITMENHGPLHLERVAPGDEERFYSAVPSAGCEELTIYLRHLANADRMAGRLRAALEELPDPAYLCWFGDHVPIMPGVYRALGVPDGRTDYLIWCNGGFPGAPVPRELRVEQLGGLILQRMGLLAARE